MLDEYDFTLDGFSANQAGIKLQKPLSISNAVPIYDEAQVAGRNGTLVSFTGAYKNRKATAQCFALDSNLMGTLSSATSLLFGTVGYRMLQTDFDPDHYMMARIVNGLEIQQRMEKLNPFKIEFDCMPQRFLVSGEDGHYAYDGGTITNPTAFESKPFIRVWGTTGETGTFTINGITVEVTDLINGMNIDCETENCYGTGGNYNFRINAPVFPTLVPGDNSVSITGSITSISYRGRWWEI